MHKTIERLMEDLENEIKSGDSENLSVKGGLGFQFHRIGSR